MYKSSYVKSLELNKPQRDSSRLTEIFYNATHIINTCILFTYVHVASFFLKGGAIINLAHPKILDKLPKTTIKRQLFKIMKILIRGGGVMRLNGN